MQNSQAPNPERATSLFLGATGLACTSLRPHLHPNAWFAYCLPLLGHSQHSQQGPCLQGLHLTGCSANYEIKLVFTKSLG